MSDRTLTLLLATVIALGGIALHRLIGPTADGMTGAALIALFQTYRRRRREQRLRAIVEIRAEDPANRARALADIVDTQLRRDVEIGVDEEGTITREGHTESFPFPASFVRFATRAYWFRWTATLALFAAASLLPLPTAGRVVAFATGLIALYGVWRATRLELALRTVIEVSPSAIAEVWPDSSRTQLHVAQQLTVKLDDDGESFWLIARSGASIHVSKHRLAFRRLAQLSQRYAIHPQHRDAAT